MGFLGSIGQIASFIPGAGGWAAGLQGIDALTTKRKGYGPANQLMNQGIGDLNNIQGNADRYNTLGNNELTDWGNMAPEDDQAFNDALGYQRRLAGGPTSQDALDLQQTFGGNVTAETDRGRSDLARNMAERGIVGGSTDVGGNMDLSGYEAAARADAANKGYLYSKGAQGNAIDNITRMIAARRAGKLSNGMNFTGGADKLYGDIASDFTGLGTQEAGVIAGQNAQQDQGVADIMNNGGADGISSIFANLFRNRKAGAPGVAGASSTGGQRPQDEFNYKYPFTGGGGAF